MRPGEGLVYSSLQSLLSLQAQVRSLQRAKQQARARHVGLHHSIFKGRGMDFAESRPYQAGDDVRTIDWRVTARSGRVHTKVFQEEREKPVLVWLDMRAPMFFATRGCFKSVVAAEVTALLIWKTLSEGDRAGGLLQQVDGHAEFKPARSRRAVLAMLRAVADASGREMARLPVRQFDDLQASWHRLRRVVEAGTQVFVISDFRAASSTALQQLAMINRQARVTLISIRDPLEEQLPEKGRLRVTDGRRGLWVNLQQRFWRQDYHERQRQALVSLQSFARKHRMPLVQLSTRDTVRERLTKLAKGLR